MRKLQFDRDENTPLPVEAIVEGLRGAYAAKQRILETLITEYPLGRTKKDSEMHGYDHIAGLMATEDHRIERLLTLMGAHMDVIIEASDAFSRRRNNPQSV